MTSPPAPGPPPAGIRVVEGIPYCDPGPVTPAMRRWLRENSEHEKATRYPADPADVATVLRDAVAAVYAPDWGSEIRRAVRREMWSATHPEHGTLREPSVLVLDTRLDMITEADRVSAADRERQAQKAAWALQERERMQSERAAHAARQQPAPRRTGVL